MKKLKTASDAFIGLIVGGAAVCSIVAGLVMVGMLLVCTGIAEHGKRKTW